MYKRALAFLLAAVLAFTPVLSVNAAETTSSIEITEIPTADPSDEVASEETKAPEETAGVEIPSAEPATSVAPEASLAPVETPERSPEAEVTPSAMPEVEPVPSEEPIESASPEVTPETGVQPAESATPEESMSPEEVATPDETLFPEESATPEELPEESMSPEDSLSPEETEEDLNIETDLEMATPADVDLTLLTGDAKGKGWTWKASTKTLTLNGYNSEWKMTLPGDSTIKLAAGSKNTVDTTQTHRHSFYAKGNLTVTGTGKLTAKYYGYEPIYAEGKTTIKDTTLSFENTEGYSEEPFYYRGYVTVIGSNITMKTKDWDEVMVTYLTLEGCQLAKGRLQNDYYYADQNAETGFYEFQIKKAPVYVTKHPVEITTLNVGKSANLSVTAKSSSGKTLKYQWYKTSDYQNPVNGANKVKDATSAKLKVTPKDRGIVYYYCEVSDGKNKVVSNLAAVVTAKKGYKLYTKNFNITKTTESVDKLAEEGWKWDKDNLTLTLKKFDYQIPYGKGNGFRIPAGITMVVEETNYLDSCSGKLVIFSSAESGSASVFTGPGTLYFDSFDFYYALSNYSIVFTGGIKVETVEFGSSVYPFILDNASVHARDYIIMEKPFTMRNNSYLEMASSFRVWNDMTIGRGCKLVCGGYVECFGDLLIEEDAEMIIEQNLVMNSTSSNRYPDRTITINGTLHIKPQSHAYQAINLYSTTSNPLKLGSGVSVIYPEGAKWDNKVKSNSTYYYGYKYNDSYKLNGLTIGKEAKTEKKITGSKKITGTPKYQSILKAPALDQKNATVSYQWQSAETPNGPWDNMSVSDVQSTYQVATKYHGRYLRVVTKGIGAYSGEIASDPVGPVVGNKGALYGLWTEADEIKYRIGYDAFDGDDTTYDVTTHVPAEGTFSYHALPIDEMAKVTFRNTTTGFSQVGKDVDIPIVSGTNKIEIEVVSGYKKTLYKINHKVEEKTAQLRISLVGYGVSLTASWTDENGPQSMAVASTLESATKSLPLGTEVTITSTCPTGEYAFVYEGLNEKPDKTKPGNPVTFVFTGAKTVKFSSNYTKAYAPEELSASWQMEEGTAEIKVKALPIPNTSPTTYVGMEFEIYDKDKNFVTYVETDETNATVDAEGYYRIKVTGLDSTKEYIISAAYDVVFNSTLYSDETTNYRLKKRKPVILTVAHDHVVLKPGEAVTVPVLYDGHEGGQLVVTDSFDKNVVRNVTAVTDGISGESKLTVTANGEGTTYVTLRGDDYEKAGEMQYVFANVRVDVIAANEAPDLRLGKKSGTLNYYDDSALTIPVYEMECGHEIEGAVFVDDKLNEKFAISVEDDRTLKVTPKVPVDDGVIDYAKWLAEQGRTGTFSSKIKVIYNGAASRESSEKLKITLKAQKPEVKTSALSLNSFYTEQTGELKISVTGETVAKIELDTAKNTGSMVAIPDYLTFNGADKSVKMDGNSLPANSLTTGIYVKIWPEGYRIPLQKKVTVKITYQKPKIKFHKSTVSIPADKPEEYMFLYLNLLPTDKKLKYKDLDVVSIRQISSLELLQLGLKQKQSHIDLSFFEVYEFDSADGEVRLAYNDSDQPIPGKAIFYVYVNKGKEPVKVTLNVKTLKTSKVIADKKTITMNNAFGTYSSVNKHTVKLTTNVTGYEIGGNIDYLKAYKVGDATKKDYSSCFSITWNYTDEKAQIGRTGSTLPTGTYKLSVYCEGIKKPAVITVKVVNEKPTLKLKADKAELSFSRAQKSSLRNEKVTLALPEKYWNSYGISEAVITAPDGSKHTFNPSGYSDVKTHAGISLTSPGWDYQKKAGRITIAALEDAAVGTYKVSFRASVSGTDGTTTWSNRVTVKVKVTDAAPAPKITPTEFTLNKDLQTYDKISVKFPSVAYEYETQGVGAEAWKIGAVTDADGKDASANLNCTITSDGYFKISANENTKYGATYKVKLGLCYINDITKYTTVTVKVSKKNATVKATAKVQGSIDLARPLNKEKSIAKIQYTFTNWNPGVYGAGGDGAYYEWEVYAKNGKKLLTTQDGALNDKGLVASGTSLSREANTTNWFYNWEKDGVGLLLNYNSAAWQRDQIAAHYTYTVKTTLKFKELEKTVKIPDVTLKVKNGAVKFGQDKKSVTLVKPDEKGRAFFTVDVKNSDYKFIGKIAAVEVVSDKAVPISKKIEVKPIYNIDNKYIFEIRWKDDTAANVKSGKVKLNVYLEGNNPKWKKPNTTLNLTVNVK